MCSFPKYVKCHITLRSLLTPMFAGRLDCDGGTARASGLTNERPLTTLTVNETSRQFPGPGKPKHGTQSKCFFVAKPYQIINAALPQHKTEHKETENCIVSVICRNVCCTYKILHIICFACKRVRGSGCRRNGKMFTVVQVRMLSTL